jgi:hypothetical protein
MPSSSSQMPPVLPPSSPPAGLNALVSSGARKILVTRTFEDDADPAFRAAVLAPESRSAAGWRPGGLVGAAGVALAESGRSVVIVQAGTGHGARRGLRELLRDVYLNGLMGETKATLGLGDWLELLDAQECTGELEVREGDATITMHIVRGSIRAIASPLAGGDERLPESALRARVSERLARILSAIQPDIGYVADLAPPVSATFAASHMDDLLRGRLRTPYLERRIEEYLTPTAQPNLRVLAAGVGGPVTGLLRRPISNLLNRLARDCDVVLIDAPPVAVAGQAAILAGLADAALLVASVAAVRSAGLLHAVDELRRAGAASVAVHAVRTPISLSPAPIR